jgi:hypothetical protein
LCHWVAGKGSHTWVRFVFLVHICEFLEHHTRQPQHLLMLCALFKVAGTKPQCLTGAFLRPLEHLLCLGLGLRVSSPLLLSLGFYVSGLGFGVLEFGIRASGLKLQVLKFISRLWELDWADPSHHATLTLFFAP